MSDGPGSGTVGVWSVPVIQDVLERAGALGRGQRVAGVTVEQLAGSGLVGQVRRLRVRYHGTSDAGPSSLVLKECSSAFAESVELARVEVGAYQVGVARLAGVDVPRMYSLDADGHDGGQLPWLLMADLGDDGFVRQIDGFTDEQAFRAVVEVAKLHARWSTQPPPAAEWLRTPVDSLVAAFCRRWMRSYTEDWPEVLGPVPTLLRDGFDGVAAQLADADRTVAHGDFHSQNIQLTPDRCTLIDFQFVQHASGMLDVARLLATSLTTDVRRAIEHDLLRVYVDTLGSLGVNDFDLGRSMVALRAGLLWNFSTPLALHLVTIQTRGTRWPRRLPILERCLSAAQDWDALELLR
ncbi:phosphotransferase [Actinophytocola sediminis]